SLFYTHARELISLRFVNARSYYSTPPPNKRLRTSIQRPSFIKGFSVVVQSQLVLVEKRALQIGAHREGWKLKASQIERQTKTAFYKRLLSDHNSYIISSQYSPWRSA